MAPAQTNFNLTMRMAWIFQSRTQMNVLPTSTPTLTSRLTSQLQLIENEMKKLKKFDKCFKCKKEKHLAKSCTKPYKPYSAVNAVLQEVKLLKNSVSELKKA